MNDSQTNLRAGLPASLAVAMIAIAAGPATGALISITNADFEATTVAADSNTPAVDGWTREGNALTVNPAPSYQWAPAGVSQAFYFTGAAGVMGISQDLPHNWAAGQTMTLRFDAWEPGFRTGPTQIDGIRAEIRQVDGTVLWASPLVSLDGTVTGSENAWNWVGTSHQHEFTILTDDFTAGTEGSPIQLRFLRESGEGVMYGDNVSLDVVPEPSVALLGLGALSFLAARRRRS